MNAEEKDLLHRHLNGDLDASEQAAFFARLQSSPELRRELASHAVDEMLISELVLEGRTAARPPVRRRAWLTGAVAAALLIGLSLILSLGRGAATGLRVVAVPEGATLRRGDVDKRLMPGTELRVGDVVITAKGGVTLESTERLVYILGNSEVLVQDPGRLQVERGIIDARGDGLVFVSKLGQATLRKAAARVDVSEERTRINAEQGSVLVERAGWPSVEIDARQYARLEPERFTKTGRLVLSTDIDDAVRRGAAFLESRRSDIVMPITSEKRHGAAPRRTYAELALLALHRAGVPSSHPMMTELLGLVKGRSLESTYAAALQALALVEIDPVAHRDRIRHCGQFLVDSQCANGQWDYFGARNSEPPPPTGELRPRSEGPASGDNSVSSYAALGLFACERAGVKIDRTVINRALMWWRICQNGDGGWGYNDSGDRTPGDGGKRTLTTNASYGSATASALAAMTAMTRLVEWGPSKKAIARGQEWLGANFGVSRNPGKDPGFAHLHWLVSAARAAELLSAEEFGGHDWYAEGAEFLIAAQRPTGDWLVEHGEFMKSERNDVLDTCLAILFLRRAP